jgi:hypothetical protein
MNFIVPEPCDLFLSKPATLKLWRYLRLTGSPNFSHLQWDYPIFLAMANRL